MACIWACARSDVALGTTLQELFDGGSISTLNVAYSDFQLTFVDSTTGTEPDFTLIEVVGLTDDPARPGLSFLSHGELTVVDAEQITVEFEYVATSLGSATRLTGSALHLDAVEFADGDPLTEDGGAAVVTADLAGPQFSDLGNLFVEADNGQNLFALQDQVQFPSAAQSVRSLVLITLAGDVVDDIVSLDAFSQRYSVVVPEPATWAAAFSLAIVLAQLRRSTFS